MIEYKAIALYLIASGVTTSQTMSRWFGDYVTYCISLGELPFSNPSYFEMVRRLIELECINRVVGTYLLQISLWISEAKKSVQELIQKGYGIILEVDSNYPELFRKLYDKPSILFTYGDTKILSGELITIVGTRTPSEWATMKAKQLSYEAVKCELVTVSGMAQGIDQVVLEETINYGGKSIAILPQLLSDSSSDCDKYGNVLFISEFPPSQKSHSKWQFISRNRLLAGIAPVTILVEAPIRSGTLITADFALMYDRSVYVVLPDVQSESAAGGVGFGIQQNQGSFIQSLYDIFYSEGLNHLIIRYKQLLELLSKGKLIISDKDERHLSTADLSRSIYAVVGKNLDTFQKYVVELVRFGIIRERKNKIVFNFSGYMSWPKI